MKNLEYVKTTPNEPHEIDLPRLIENLESTLREHPEDGLLLRQQILILRHVSGDPNDVLKLCFEQLELDKEGVYEADVYHIMARMYAKIPDVDQSIEYYKKTLVSTKPFIEAIEELADLYRQQGSIDEAIAVYAYFDSDSIDDGRFEMYVHQASCYYAFGRAEDAMHCFIQALAVSPNENTGWLLENVGRSLWMQKRYSEAMEWFRKAVEKDPKSAEAEFGIGLCYQNLDDPYRALHYYYRALELKPNYVEAYNNIAAVIVAEDGDYKQGVATLQKALDLVKSEKSRSTIYLNLARLYGAMREHASAEYYKSKFYESVGLDGLMNMFGDEDDDV